MLFVGVTTGGSAATRLFPAWARALGLGDARLIGTDLPLGAPAWRYRDVVDRIATDPGVRGALVTSHKMSLYQSAGGRFWELDDLARRCGEISGIVKSPRGLAGSARDPITAGRALRSLLGGGYFARTGGHVLCLGAGGAGTALAVHLTGETGACDRPPRITVVERLGERLRHLRQVLGSTPAGRAVELVQATGPDAAGRLVAGLPAASLVVNATGLGKDLPGSRLPDGVRFPPAAVAWDLNYRGNLRFLTQARAAPAELEVRAADGREYFLHGWAEHLAAVYDLAWSPVLVERMRAVEEQP